MFPDDGGFGGAAGRAGNGEVLAQHRPVLSAGLHQQPGLVVVSLGQDSQVDLLVGHHALLGQVVGGVAAVEAGLLEADVLQQEVLVAHQGAPLLQQHGGAVLEPLNDGRGHAGGRLAGKDHVVPDVAHDAGGGGGGGELVNVSDAEQGRGGHQEHPVQPRHAGVAAGLALPVTPARLDLDLHPVPVISDLDSIPLVTLQGNAVVDPADFLI